MRALLTGVVLVAAISLISPWAVLIVKGSLLTGNAIPVIAVLFFFVLTALVAPLLKSLSRRLAFTRADLILIYAMMLVAGAVVTTGFTGGFMSIISGIYYYATPENNWANLFIPHLDPLGYSPRSQHSTLVFRGAASRRFDSLVRLDSAAGGVDFFYGGLFGGYVLPRRYAAWPVDRPGATGLSVDPVAPGNDRGCRERRAAHRSLL